MNSTQIAPNRPKFRTGPQAEPFPWKEQLIRSNPDRKLQWASNQLPGRASLSWWRAVDMPMALVQSKLRKVSCIDLKRFSLIKDSCYSPQI